MGESVAGIDVGDAQAEPAEISRSGYRFAPQASVRRRRRDAYCELCRGRGTRRIAHGVAEDVRRGIGRLPQGLHRGMLFTV